jgi:hypothetical protein
MVAWTLLAIIAKCILPAPNLGKEIRERIRMWRNGQIANLWRRATNPNEEGVCRRRQNQATDESQQDINKRRCHRLVQDGQYGRATQALTSLGIDQTSAAAYNIMIEKHPQTSTPSPTPGGANPDPIHLTQSQVFQALSSFQTGTAAGPSGLRAEHLKASTTCTTPAKAEKAVAALTRLTNSLAAGHVPASVSPYLCGTNLFAAMKKDGSHRPIAVGEVVRRLVSKCMVFHVQSKVADYLKPPVWCWGPRWL